MHGYRADRLADGSLDENDGINEYTQEIPLKSRPTIPTKGPPDFSAIDQGETIDAGIDIRKPRADELFAILKSEIHIVQLVEVSRGTGTLGRNEFYYVEDYLAAEISSRVRDYWAIPAWSLPERQHFIWMAKINDTGWGQSIQRLIARPLEFFASNAFRMESDRQRGTYRFRCLPNQLQVPPLPRSIGKQLADSLGEDHIITSADHPIYQMLTEGEVLP